ncbi:hypothetical protein JTB14_003351 [Gonioctena quinquepunctata]|nr:hypothetical protein JTB14_003351 [Gonioctena quinquepunctata]
MENICVLCCAELKYIKYNLKSSRTRLSGSTLMSLIVNITGEMTGIHHNTCELCFELINELDAVTIRVAEINNKLREYIEMRTVYYHSAEEKIENNFSDIEISQFCDGSNISALDETLKEVIHNCNTEIGHNIGGHLFEGENGIIHHPGENINSSRLEETFTQASTHINQVVLDTNECNIPKPLQTHEKLTSRMNPPNRSFVCEICGRSYKYKQNFESHMKVHSGASSFSCTYCQKTFTQKIDLVRHVPIHTGEKPHQCEKCGKRFIHHTSFNLHMKTHTGKKTHNCTMCNQGFTTTSHLKRHIRMHTGEKNFACTRCGKRFAERYNLAAHEKLHNLKKSTSKQKKFSCNVCGEGFGRKQKLEEHQTKKHLSVLANS